jgi:hypothetical protein
VSMHSVEIVLQCRWAAGMSPRGPLSVSQTLSGGEGLQRLAALPWPRNLFGDHATIAELLAPSVENQRDDLCACGCGREHRQRLPRILPNPDGDGFDLHHFWSVACERTWSRSQRDGGNEAYATSREGSCRQF